MEFEEFRTLNDINTEIPEGKLLLAAISRMTGFYNPRISPDEELREVVRTAKMCFAQVSKDPREDEKVAQLRVQLAGCLIAADGNISNPAEQGDYGWSPAYQAVLRLRQLFDDAQDTPTPYNSAHRILRRGIDEVARNLGARLDDAKAERDVMDQDAMDLSKRVKALEERLVWPVFHAPGLQPPVPQIEGTGSPPQPGSVCKNG